MYERSFIVSLNAGLLDDGKVYKIIDIYKRVGDIDKVVYYEKIKDGVIARKDGLIAEMKPRILVVDDDEQNRAPFREAEREGFEVRRRQTAPRP